MELEKTSLKRTFWNGKTLNKIMKSLFKSEQGKRDILRLYDEKLDELHIDYEYLQVETSFGKTNIIASGEKSTHQSLLCMVPMVVRLLH